jgi:hypothetical protein
MQGFWMSLAIVVITAPVVFSIGILHGTFVLLLHPLGAPRPAAEPVCGSDAFRSSTAFTLCALPFVFIGIARSASYSPPGR